MLNRTSFDRVRDSGGRMSQMQSPVRGDEADNSDDGDDQRRSRLNKK
jgi:hypothetical protein